MTVSSAEIALISAASAAHGCLEAIASTRPLPGDEAECFKRLAKVAGMYADRLERAKAAWVAEKEGARCGHESS